MKRIIAIILALTMFLSLSACSGNDTEKGKEKDKTNKKSAQSETTGAVTETDPTDTTDGPGANEAVIYRLISFALEGEEITGELIEMMGGGYIVFNGNGTGLFSMFGEVFPITYDESTMDAAGEKMAYTITDGGMEFTMDDGTIFVLEVTDEMPELPGGNGGDYSGTEPVYGPDLGSYENPSDHPHEGTDLTVYNGTYRALEPREEDEETWLQVTAFNDFMILEYYGLIEGSVYRYWLEEFWPGMGWYSYWADATVSGRSQEFSSMAQYENYSGLPFSREITLTMDGILLNGDAGAETYIRDDGFDGGHTSEKELWDILQQSSAVHRDFDYQYDSADVLGTWGFWNGYASASLTFEEDGSFTLYWKDAAEPIVLYRGVYGFGENSGNLEIMAERAGYGSFPYLANWEWSLDEWGYLSITDFESVLLDGQCNFWRIDDAFFTVMDADTALSCVYPFYCLDGAYSDRYDNYYSYYFSLPKFYHSENEDLQRINKMITDFYYPIIETELNAMEVGEILTYDYVDWQASAYNGVLFLHVFACTYDWEEHDVFYIDLDTMEQIDARQVLDRLHLDEDYFLDTVRTRAEELFIAYFSDIPEADREDYGYYDCLEETVSDDFVNLDLPIVADRYGNVTVYMKISSMAGSGLMWMPECLFW